MPAVDADAARVFLFSSFAGLLILAHRVGKAKSNGQHRGEGPCARPTLSRVPFLSLSALILSLESLELGFQKTPL